MCVYVNLCECVCVFVCLCACVQLQLDLSNEIVAGSLLVHERKVGDWLKKGEGKVPKARQRIDSSWHTESFA